MLGTAGVAPHYQIELSRRGRMDHMTVRVEARPGVGPEQREAAAWSIAQRVKDWVGVAVHVVVVRPDTLERSDGKPRRAKDLREQ